MSLGVVGVAAMVMVLVVALVVVVVMVGSCVGFIGMVGVWSDIVYFAGLILAFWSSNTASSSVVWLGKLYWCISSIGCLSIAFSFRKST